MVHKLREKQNILMAVDGPYGPRETIKEGSHYFTEKTHIPTIPLSIKYHLAIPLIWRWDRYLIPLPFSKVTLHFGRPLMKDCDHWDSMSESLG
jgi:lysophospholipid acyltransferase (LPLAT)-like uncharacterized protein